MELLDSVWYICDTVSFPQTQLNILFIHIKYKSFPAVKQLFITFVVSPEHSSSIIALLPPVQISLLLPPQPLWSPLRSDFSSFFLSLIETQLVCSFELIFQPNGGWRRGGGRQHSQNRNEVETHVCFQCVSRRTSDPSSTKRARKLERKKKRRKRWTVTKVVNG